MCYKHCKLHWLNGVYNTAILQYCKQYCSIAVLQYLQYNIYFILFYFMNGKMMHCSLYRSAIFWFDFDFDLLICINYIYTIQVFLLPRSCSRILEFNVYHFVWFVAMLIRLFYYVYYLTSDHRLSFWLLLHYILTRFILLFWKCKSVCINLPSDFVSVVLHNKSNDFLGPTTVSILFTVLGCQLIRYLTNWTSTLCTLMNLCNLIYVNVCKHKHIICILFEICCNKFNAFN